MGDLGGSCTVQLTERVGAFVALAKVKSMLMAKDL